MPAVCEAPPDTALVRYLRRCGGSDCLVFDTTDQATIAARLLRQTQIVPQPANPGQKHFKIGERRKHTPSLQDVVHCHASYNKVWLYLKEDRDG